MRKLNLFALKRDGERAEIIIEKSQAFVILIRKIIKEVIKVNSDWNLFITEDKKFNCIDEKIEDWTDRCKSLKYKDYELDIFVGKKKIIIVVRSSTKNQQKFINNLMKFYKWKI